MDFGFNENGDLDIENGLTIVSGSDELAQRLKVGFTINLGEFFTHINYGLPWLRGSEFESTDLNYFLGDDNVTTLYIVNQLDAYVESIDQVTSVTSTYSYDSSNRSLTYTPSITGEDGEIINFPAYILDI